MYLNCKTCFSLMYGTYKTAELVAAAADLGVTSLALTNINSTADAWDFVSDCRDKHIRPVVGTEVRNGYRLCYLLLARNNQGLTAINRFLSRHLQEDEPFPSRFPLHPDVFTIYPFGSIDPGSLMPGEFIGVQTTEVNKLFGLDMRAHGHKFVIRHPVTVQNKTYYNVHRLLRCIDDNILLSMQDRKIIAGEHETFLPPAAIMQAFGAYPALIYQTQHLLNQCSIEIVFHEDKTVKLYGASEADDRRLLHFLAMDGLKKRYGNNNPEATRRVKEELSVIDTLGFNAYYLVTWDILGYAKRRGFFYVGRGSGANSIVAYCLEITNVEPIALDLYFERFLNEYRTSPPDFDIDFSWKDRDELTEYIFHRFGQEHVCLLGAYATFQYRAIIRELGKVFGLPKHEIDKLGSRSATFNEDKVQRQIYQYGALIKNLPSHLSVHAGGVLISQEPVHTWTATTMPPKGFVTSQIDMFVAEKIGLYKLDILSQRGLGHIREAVDLVLQNHGIRINIHDTEAFKKDPRVADQLRSADTIGVFYVESPAMRQLLKKLCCDDYITLVAASSIIRPGVAQSGMMRQYIYFYHHPDKVTYLHPKMEELMKETFGVMVFQEDVIKVVHHIGRLDKAKADIVRKGMSGKYRGGLRLEDLQTEFMANCHEDGIQESVAKEIWRQVESFRGYSFSKAHSASYADESYQGLFLKAYYPAEFMVAVINNFGGFYTPELYFIELRKTGVELLAPCVNEGEYLTSITGRTVYMGFVHVQGLETAMIETLLAERKRNGPFTGLADLMERAAPGLEQLCLLIRIGALRFTGKHKKELLWQAHFYHSKKQAHTPRAPALFNEAPVEYTMPVFAPDPYGDIMDEVELLGFPFTPIFDLVDADLAAFAGAADLPRHVGRPVRAMGLFITAKEVGTKLKQTMFFGTFLDKQGEWLDTVHFPGSFEYAPFTGRGFYELRGRVVEEFGVYAIEVHYCRPLPIKRREVYNRMKALLPAAHPPGQPPEAPTLTLGAGQAFLPG